MSERFDSLFTMGMMIANRKHLTNYKAHRAGEYLTLYLETSDLGLKSKHKITLSKHTTSKHTTLKYSTARQRKEYIANHR